MSEPTAVRDILGPSAMPVPEVPDRPLRAIDHHDLVLFKRRVNALAERSWKLLKAQEGSTGRALTIPMLVAPVLQEVLRTRELTTLGDEELFRCLWVPATTTATLGSDIRPSVDYEPPLRIPRVQFVPTTRYRLARLQGLGATAIKYGIVHAGDRFRCDVESHQRTVSHQMASGGRRGLPIKAFVSVFAHGRYLGQVEEMVAWRQRIATRPHAWHRTWRDHASQHLLARAMSQVESQIHAAKPVAFTDVARAASELLPGNAADFEGYGGQAIGLVPTPILRRMRQWIALSPARQIAHQRLDAAITCIIAARRAAATAPAPAPTEASTEIES
ncbi:hypothetical protein GAU_2287 [Gemmatimonas aurantiaca T-27]|uniref:Uncharacterized protein n=1 Tax=Gemmatimonas aurantiaca (strain DSM 14586 / JCM 11422 / NBRC 100505 / T-27) TaxID=379066 RepID=C1AAS3_GEMAT|nr:hypothetical protein [Gemmatimonas aurantiaca]BAH39329.1 hypothetical protein GAU_2287 [Gemmatimonas aurantiaca T-27]